MENKNVTSQLESQNPSTETYDSNPENLFTQTKNPNNKRKPKFRENCNCSHKPTHSISKCFRKQREDGERKRNPISRSKSPVKLNNQYFKACQMNNLLLIPSTVILVLVMTQEIVQIQEIDFVHIDPLVLDHLQLQVINVKIISLDIGIVIENSIPIELHHVQDTLNFTSNEGTLDLLSDFLTEIFSIVLFLDPTLEIDST